MNETWAHWFRGNFDKFLLVGLFAFLISLLIHTIHAKDVDPSIAQWFRETCNTVMGTLIGIITGVSMARRDSQKTAQETEPIPNKQKPKEQP